jgi:hypothetical protein
VRYAISLRIHFMDAEKGGERITNVVKFIFLTSKRNTGHRKYK